MYVPYRDVLCSLVFQTKQQKYGRCELFIFSLSALPFPAPFLNSFPLNEKFTHPRKLRYSYERISLFQSTISRVWRHHRSLRILTNRCNESVKNVQQKSADPVSSKRIRKTNPFIWLFFCFCKETEMSRIGKNEATFKFFFFLVSHFNWWLGSCAELPAGIIFFSSFLSTSGRWSVSPLTEFADVAAGAPDFRQQKKKEMDSSCEIDVVTYS